MLVLLLAWYLHAACDDDLRTTAYREPPRDGLAKQGRTEYKHINQTLGSLVAMVQRGDPRPPGFTAEVVPPTWPDAPVSGVRLTGALAPPHPLAGRALSLEIQREGLVFLATLMVGADRYERVIEADRFLEVFPFRGPAGHGLLLSLEAGLRADPALFHWKRLPTDAPR